MSILNATRLLKPLPGRSFLIYSQLNGLTGGPVVLPTESMNEFQRFSAEIVGSLEPETPVEREFAQIVANLQWRLKRIKPIEDGLLNMDRFGLPDPAALPESGRDCEEIAEAFMNHGRSLANLSGYEHRLYRNMKDALNKVEALKAERERREEEDAQATHNRAIKSYFLSPHWPSHGPPADPIVDAPPANARENQAGGFVFPKSEITAETDQFSPVNRPEPSPPGEEFERPDEKEAA